MQVGSQMTGRNTGECESVMAPNRDAPRVHGASRRTGRTTVVSCGLITAIHGGKQRHPSGLVEGANRVVQFPCELGREIRNVNYRLSVGEYCVNERVAGHWGLGWRLAADGHLYHKGRSPSFDLLNRTEPVSGPGSRLPRCPPARTSNQRCLRPNP
jgi:hypothetical protein